MCHSTLEHQCPMQHYRRKKKKSVISPYCQSHYTYTVCVCVCVCVPLLGLVLFIVMDSQHVNKYLHCSLCAVDADRPCEETASCLLKRFLLCTTT